MSICQFCRGAKMLLEIGKNRNTAYPCPECKDKAENARNTENQIIRGVPIPGDVKMLGGETKPMKYPWKIMEVGDLWETDLSCDVTRGRIINSLRYFEHKYKGKEFCYRLTKNKETGERGLEIWRVK